MVGGNRYPQLGAQIWLFAVLGGCLAIVQFTLVAGLAVRNVAVAALIWLTVAAEAVIVLAVLDHPSVREVIGVVCLINLLSAGCAVGLRLLPARRSARVPRPRWRRPGSPHRGDSRSGPTEPIATTPDKYETRSVRKGLSMD